MPTVKTEQLTIDSAQRSKINKILINNILKKILKSEKSIDSSRTRYFENYYRVLRYFFIN